MPVNPLVESPTIRALPTVDSAGNYTFGASTPRGIDIWEDGDIKIESVGGQTVTRSFAGLTDALPYRWVVQVYKLYGIGNGTTVPLASLDLLQ